MTLFPKPKIALLKNAKDFLMCLKKSEFIIFDHFYKYCKKRAKK